MTMVRYDAMMRQYKGDSAMPRWYDDDDAIGMLGDDHIIAS